jgi:hypothetical protein
MYTNCKVKLSLSASVFKGIIKIHKKNVMQFFLNWLNLKTNKIKCLLQLLQNL